MELTEKQLRNRLKGNGPLSSRPVNGKNLSDGQEEGLCLYIQKMDDIGFLVIPEAVEANANAILARYHEDPNSEPRVMGEGWAGRFLHRYNKKGFNIRTQGMLGIGRFEAQQPNIIKVFFSKLEAAWKKYHIRPEDCYNMD
jgi:hypothetical protein